MKPTLAKLYFRVYQDKDSTGYGSYVDTLENIQKSIPHWFDDAFEHDNDLPVLEPVMMTEMEFKNLPEFGGF